MPKSAQLTPMLRHYLELKAEHPDALLFYRMGDFYELFFEDAERAAPILEVTLTARQRGTESEAPMCGVPHHALEVYLAKAVRAGLKVAICDQVEDPAKAKGLVKREVTRVVTPGTLSEPELLEADEDNYLAAVVWEEPTSAAAFLDISTGSFFVRRWNDAGEALDDLRLHQPRELLTAGGSLPAELAGWAERRGVCVSELEAAERPDDALAGAVLERQLGTATLRGFGLERGEPGVRAAAAAVEYARRTQQSELRHVRQLAVRQTSSSLWLDATTLANLEVFAAQRGGDRRATLLGVLDRTVSPGGGRLLRAWLKQPLREPAAIERRLDAVAELVDEPRRRGAVREQLRGVGDPERLVGRAVLGRMSPREAATLRACLTAAPELQARLADASAELLRRIAAADPLSDLLGELERRLADEPPAAVKEGGIIRQGVDDELDRVRSLARDGKRHILALEQKERERTGIGSLKIRFNKVFGYYLEVTKANQHLVPGDYVRKQTLANAERYITPELKQLEETILTAEQDQLEIEARLFGELVGELAAESERLGALARELAAADAGTEGLHPAPIESLSFELAIERLADKPTGA